MGCWRSLMRAGDSVAVHSFALELQRMTFWIHDAVRLRGAQKNLQGGSVLMAAVRTRYPAGISRNTVLLAFASLFADISSEMLYPILPIFLIARHSRNQNTSVSIQLSAVCNQL